MNKYLDNLLKETYSLLGESAFPVGTIRKWKAGNFQKQSDGSWAEVIKKEPPKTHSTAYKESPKAPIQLDTPHTVEPVKVSPKVPRELTQRFQGAFDESRDISPKNQFKIRSLFSDILKTTVGMTSPRNTTGSYQVKDRLLTETKSLAYFLNKGNKIVVTPSIHNSAKNALRKYNENKPLTANEQGAFRVLLHEQLHSYSPINQDILEGKSLLVEEVCVEMAARLATKRQFGSLGHGSYSSLVEPVKKAIETAHREAGVKQRSKANAMLAKSAVKTLKSKNTINSAEQYIEILAGHLSEGHRNKAKLKSTLIKHISASLEGAVLESETVPNIYFEVSALKRNDYKKAALLMKKAEHLSKAEFSDIASMLYMLQDNPDLLDLEIKGQIYDT